ncbi:accessory gene regulator B family protein [Clostridium sp. B9]|uniref:accessory gene regulator B family protein n=1 Tax=Clostridium sp. B9 TaxID=3423224 RepID=UPI003D2F4229
MVKNLISKFINYISMDSNVDKEKLVEIEFILRVLTYEAIKIFLVLSILGVLGYFKEALVIVITMTLLKPFIGGYHEDTQIKCFIATSIIVSSILILSLSSNLSLLSCIILNLFSIFSIYNKAPVIDERFPLTKESLIKKNRRIGICNSIILSIISIVFFRVTWISQAIAWTLLVQAMLLFNKYKKI